MDSDFLQARVVRIAMQVVLSCRNLIDPISMHVVTGRAFEAREIETSKHVRLLSNSIATADFLVSASNQFAKSRHQLSRHSLEPRCARHQVPQAHLLDVFAGRFSAFTIAPRDQSKQ